MKLALVAVALVLLVLPIAANAYTVQGSLGGPAEVTFGTGHDGFTFWTTTTDLVVLGPSAQYYSSYFVTQDPGEWKLRTFDDGGYSGWFTFKLWVTDLGPQGPSQQQWAVYTTTLMHWGEPWQKIYQGALFSTTGTSTNPNFIYSRDFISQPVFFHLVAVPEPGSMMALLGGCIGFAATIIRQRRK